MSYVHKILITTLFQYLLAAQGNVITVFDKENITCPLPQGENYTWYKYGCLEYGLIYNKIDAQGKYYQVPAGGGIFACEQQNERSAQTTTHLTCNTSNIFIIPSLEDKEKNKAKENDRNIGQGIGENVSFSCQFDAHASFVLLWIAVYPDGTSQCLLSAEVERTSYTFNTTFNKLCCPITGIQKRLHASNSSELRDVHQYHNLTITSIAASDNGHYLCVIYSWEAGYKWKVANNQSLKVTGNLDTELLTAHAGDAGSQLEDAPASSQTAAAEKGDVTLTSGVVAESTIYIAAGTIGGVVTLVGILLLIIFCIKTKGKQMKTNQSPPNAVDLPDDYECMPYAVSERKQENPETMYSLAQSPKLTTEYSEVELKHMAKPGAEYSEISLKPLTVDSAEYSEIDLKSGDSNAGAIYSMVNKIYK